jgi:hypothetical protein
MEKLILAEDIIEKYLNEFTLINIVKMGIITPYDQQFFNPIDVKKILDFFDEVRRHINQQRESPEWAIDKNNDLPKECNELLPVYEIASNRDRVSWTALYKECLRNIKEAEHFKRNDIQGIPSCQFFEIWDGLGNSQIKEIIYESIFKENEVITAMASIEVIKNDKPKEEIGESERKNWLKIIYLLAHSLNVELKNGNETCFFREKGNDKKIVPLKLSEHLEQDAVQMNIKKSGLSSETIRKILNEAEDYCLPDLDKYYRENFPEK